MADEIQSFGVVVPVGVLPSQPLIVPLSMPPRIVDEIHIQVPPGPRGEVGFQVGAGGNQVFPMTPGAFVVTDNETVKWPVENALTSGGWQLIVYNTGRRPHTLWVRFLVRVPGLGAAVAAAPGLLQPLDPSAPAAVAPPSAAAPPPSLTLPAPPSQPPPGVPIAPGPVGVPGPQAPALPGLPAPPPLPPLPTVAIDAATSAVLDQIEAAGQAAIEGTATAANAAALADWLEALGQAAHEGVKAATPAPPPSGGSTRILI